MSTKPSFLQGPTEPALLNITLGDLIDQQAKSFPNRCHIDSSWQHTRLSYQEFSDRSKTLARSLLEHGLQYGDNVGIFLGSGYEYLEVMAAAGRVGMPSVSFNTTYTPSELSKAVDFTECKMVFISTSIGARDLSSHIEAIQSLPSVQHLVLVRGSWQPTRTTQVHTYDSLFERHPRLSKVSDSSLKAAQARVKRDDVLNMQFTSGTTGSPKATKLTHHNLINNARIMGFAWEISSNDIVLAQAPLFHCLGSVGTWILPLCFGASLAIPAESFDPVASIKTAVNNATTIIIAVPAMVSALLEVSRKTKLKPQSFSFKRGFVAGSPVAPSLVAAAESELGIGRITNALGMTELSPASFAPPLEADVQHRVVSVGKILPHESAKIIDTSGRIVPVGTRGELCVSGYNVCLGYFKNKEKTDETIKVDENGVRWLHTGDECYFAEDGYCYITGRIKDIIIRGGENIYPGEIEFRLVVHPGIDEASVFGVTDEKYGEAVACVLKGNEKKKDEEIQEWILQTLGRHKVPKYMFWLGDDRFGQEYPKTGSGKIQKFELKKTVERLLEKDKRARL